MSLNRSCVCGRTYVITSSCYYKHIYFCAAYKNQAEKPSIVINNTVNNYTMNVNLTYNIMNDIGNKLIVPMIEQQYEKCFAKGGNVVDDFLNDLLDKVEDSDYPKEYKDAIQTIICYEPDSDDEKKYIATISRLLLDQNSKCAEKLTLEYPDRKEDIIKLQLKCQDTIKSLIVA